jgi:hypothetical protein
VIDWNPKTGKTVCGRSYAALKARAQIHDSFEERRLSDKDKLRQMRPSGLIAHLTGTPGKQSRRVTASQC